MDETVEQTELREQFFAEAQTDPYTHMVLAHVANAWVDGYEQALRDHGLDDELHRKSRGERHRDALEWLTDARRKAQAQAIVALASLGKILGPKGAL